MERLSIDTLPSLGSMEEELLHHLQNICTPPPPDSPAVSLSLSVSYKDFPTQQRPSAPSKTSPDSNHEGTECCAETGAHFSSLDSAAGRMERLSMDTLPSLGSMEEELLYHLQNVCTPPPDSPAVSLSLSVSYKDFPTQQRPSAPSKTSPDRNHEEILSHLRNLKEKIGRLELEKRHDQSSLTSTLEDASSPRLQRDEVSQGFCTSAETSETRDQSSCSHALITKLDAAESRCVKLERQLDLMRRMCHIKTHQTSPLKEQVHHVTAAPSCRNPLDSHVSMKSSRSADLKVDPLAERVQMEKLERLEQDYVRITRRQTDTQKFIPQQTSSVKPHYRLNRRDVDFVIGMSAGCSHPVRANIPSVLSPLKNHQPLLSTKQVLNTPETTHRGHSNESSSRTDELSVVLQALREEQQLMSMKRDELTRQLEGSMSKQERKALHREQERLLLEMEKKGEQIGKLYRYQRQAKRVHKEAKNQKDRGDEERRATTAAPRGHTAAQVKPRPGELSRRNLGLLRDLKALQMSLKT